MTSSLTHYFVYHKSQNFDPQECVHNNSSRKVGGGRRYVKFSLRKWTLIYRVEIFWAKRLGDMNKHALERLGSAAYYLLVGDVS